MEDNENLKDNKIKRKLKSPIFKYKEKKNIFQ